MLHLRRHLSLPSARITPDALRLVPLDRSSLLQITWGDSEEPRWNVETRLPATAVTTARVVDAALVPQQPKQTFDCLFIGQRVHRLLGSSELLQLFYDLLRPGGVLVGAAATQSVAERYSIDPDTVGRRLAAVGFGRVNGVVNRRRGRPCAIAVRAWKPPMPASPVERVDALRRWAHETIKPDHAVGTDYAEVILAQRAGWCRDYAVVVGEAMRREGLDVRWISMTASDLPRKRWPSGGDTHEVVEVTLPDGTEHVIDATVDVRFPSSVGDLLRDPRLADVERNRDARYVDRGYDAYSTSFWYRHVRRIQVRASPRDPGWSVPVARVSSPTRLSRRLLTPRRRPLLRWLRAAVRTARPRVSSSVVRRRRVCVPDGALTAGRAVNAMLDAQDQAARRGPEAG
jgi:hypothetical protein